MMALPENVKLDGLRQRPRLRVRWLAALVIVALAAAGGWWTLRQPPQYRAECLLDYGREPFAVGRGDTLVSEEWYRTQDFLLASNAVVERAVEALRLDKDRAFLELSARDSLDGSRAAAMEKVREQLTISKVDGTHIARIAIDDADPKRAASIANALVDAYLKRAIEERTASAEHAFGWLSAQIARTNQQLSETEGEIQTYLERHTGPPMPLSERQNLLTEEIKQLTHSLVDARLHRIELAARLAKLKSATQRDNPFDVHAPEIDENEQAKQLHADYLALVLKQTELELAQDESSQAVQLGHSRLMAVRAQMLRTIEGVLQSAQAELAAAQQVESQVQAALERTNATVRELQRDQLEYGRLERARTESETLLKALRERSAAAVAANASGGLSPQIVEPAVPPPDPVNPPLLRGAALGALLALPLAAGLLRIMK